MSVGLLVCEVVCENGEKKSKESVSCCVLCVVGRWKVEYVMRNQGERERELNNEIILSMFMNEIKLSNRKNLSTIIYFCID